MSRKRYAKMIACVSALLLLSGCTGTKTDFNTESLSSIDMEKEEVTVSIPGLTEEYHFIFISDLHIIVESDEIAKEEVETVRGRIQWSSGQRGQSAADFWEVLTDSLNTCRADGILFGGDMVDFASAANTACLKEGLDKLDTPYLYVRADHDSLPFYCDGVEQEDCDRRHAEIDGNSEVWLQEFPEFCVAGLNNSTSQITETALKRMKEIFAMGKPVILVTHVPINPLQDDSLERASKEVWQDRALVWGEGCYYEPNEQTKEFLELIYAEDSPVKEVLCGHLHFEWDGNITENTHQHVFGAAFDARYGVIHVLCAEE